MRIPDPALAPKMVSALLYKLQYIKGLIYEKEYQGLMAGDPEVITCLYALDAKDPYWQRGKQFLFSQMLKLFNFPLHYFQDQDESSIEDMDLSWGGLLSLHRQRMNRPGCDVKFYDYYMECLTDNYIIIEALYDACVQTVEIRTLARLLEGHRSADTPIFKAIRDVQILDGDEVDELYDMAEELNLGQGPIVDMLMDHLFKTHPFLMTNKAKIRSGEFDLDSVLRYMNNCADLYSVVDQQYKSWCLFNEYDLDSLEHYESLGQRYYEVQTLYTSFLWDLHYRQSPYGALWDPGRAKEEVVCWMNQLWTYGADILIRQMAVKRMVQKNAWFHLMPEVEGSRWYSQYLEEGDTSPIALSKLQEELSRREDIFCALKEMNVGQRVHRTQKRLIKLLLPQACHRDVTYYDGPIPYGPCTRALQYRRLHKLVSDYIDTGKEETLGEIWDFIMFKLRSFFVEEEHLRVPSHSRQRGRIYSGRRNVAVRESRCAGGFVTEGHAQTTACTTSQNNSASVVRDFVGLECVGRNTMQVFDSGFAFEFHNSRSA
ncbi:uncharacterized protein LOC106172476 [Lingula anatina]|uniref:Uncharacterized protein LOC106172476 n=1 Tax=Lingula anatina TaxID=7574 RepID=A0A1S3JFK0_LINAN|nr:uncharacterized protein LOC106172476 [Lingula anatina]|eukprot:XP_013408664.1 uncharacterized protein LOC106172476 [Lingula anatina]